VLFIVVQNLVRIGCVVIKYESFNVMQVWLENAYSRPEGQSLLGVTDFEMVRS